MSGSGPELDTFGGTFPFAPHYVSVGGARLHHVEAGSGEPVVMVHGNPTWSYIYRNFIGPIAGAGYRAIAPDLIGFGRSDKPVSTYTYRGHIDSLTGHLLALDLREITLVVQDWGGPIGLGFAARHPDRVKRLVILNARPRPFEAATQLPPIFAWWREPITGEVLVQGLNAFVDGMIPNGIFKKERVTAQLMAAYRSPFPDFNSRAAILAFARGHPIGASHPEYKLESRTSNWVAKFRGPALLICPLRDHAYGARALGVWREMLPQATVHTIEDAGHYCQEDAHEWIVPWIIEFLLQHP
ncbi:MAG: alpha/beta fold hydrolase [Candidatus Dormibacteraeota bacterium]|uniref:Alpha/beta fold hydrolase n=1 Tax=Candidatus Dormiibacter inghamiae TaxID=3127013 RepID=A0A934KFB6_9BACT|nr:alpha/beta fold hydrolase [Candidatus Dormibacteraeota bacterium]MBJ7606162.1 alpha/beta fold hydrolase [Candidatus Dormibacteraeota bacterium]